MSLPLRLPESDRDEVFVSCIHHPAQRALMTFHDIALCETCYHHILSAVVLELREQQLVQGGLPHE